MGAYSEEVGERLHQNILNFERRYPGQYNKRVMGDTDYIWRLIHESDFGVLSEIWINHAFLIDLFTVSYCI